MYVCLLKEKQHNKRFSAIFFKCLFYILNTVLTPQLIYFPSKDDNHK